MTCAEYAETALVPYRSHACLLRRGPRPSLGDGGGALLRRLAMSARAHSCGWLPLAQGLNRVKDTNRGRRGIGGCQATGEGRRQTRACPSLAPSSGIPLVQLSGQHGRRHLGGLTLCLRIAAVAVSRSLASGPQWAGGRATPARSRKMRSHRDTQHPRTCAAHEPRWCARARLLGE